MRTAATLVELLRARTSAAPDAVPYIFLEDGERDARSITMRELDARARAIAAAVLGVARPGDRALLLFPPGLDYIAAFFGCLYAGVIAVPAYPPDPRRLARTVPRLSAIVRGAGAELVLTTRTIGTLAGALVPHAPELARLRWLAVDEAADATGWRPPDIDGDAIALLQFTSGSTAAPRGVVLPHAAVMANLAAIHAAFGLEGRPPRTVSWLPPYHDMGLIGCILGPLYSGGSAILMSPLHFLQQPVRWLRAITRYRADVSGGPNFAYDLCVRRIDPTAHDLDLSTWEIAFNGAEVVRAATLDRFTDKFGLRRSALMPCYGLAETTLLATAVARAAAPRVLELSRTALERGAVVHADLAAPDRVAQVSAGTPPPGVTVVIADPEARALGDDQLGEIWLAGASVGRGYWGVADSATTFAARLADGRGPFLRTGDLGFVRDGALFVTGRIKDVIILHGRTVFPDDVEQVVAAAHAALRPGGTAAFGAEIADREQLVIVAELERDPGDPAEIRAAIRAAVASAFDLAVHDVALLAAGALPKTSSGKVQRHACRAGYLAGALAGQVLRE